jgi:pimeloyl-ACP methyl ester carboxylesterase
MPRNPEFHTMAYAGLAADEVGRVDERPSIVLLHGLTFDRRMWRPALTELEQIEPGRHAIAFDLPGHGETPDEAAYDLASIVDRVHSAILDAGIDAPVLVGHSASTATAAMYAAQHPTSGIVLVEGSFVIEPFVELVQSLAPVLRGPGFGAAWERISSTAFRLDEVSPEVREFVMATSRPRQDVVLGHWQDLLERPSDEMTSWISGGTGVIRRSGIPVTVVLGTQPSEAEQAWTAANLPEARIEVWPRSGHFPHLAHPLRFARLLAGTAVGASVEPAAAAR